MSLKIWDTLEPQGDFPAVRAGDVQMGNGNTLEQEMEQIHTGAKGESTAFIPLTQAQHDALSGAGMLDDDPYYLIVRAATFQPEGLTAEQMAVLEAAGLLPGSGTA